MNSNYFHFTLGPVQGFVAQARRTRDFWAGSFLLSWLSAVAMKAVEKQGGEIIFPTVNTHYLDWLEHRGQHRPPQLGCVPNRFKGGIAKVPDDFVPEQIVNSVQRAWLELAEQVWQHDLKHCGSATRRIWERQITSFWEISWALSANPEESNLLDRRKNWRSYLPPEEPGVKCMMMDGWQELSGVATPNAKALAAFWQPLRESSASLMTDLREQEYLCAIAFVKRRFVRVFEHLKITMPNDWTLYGWRVSSAVPSVAYMAAAPWLAQVLSQAPEAAIEKFHHEAHKLTRSYGEYDIQLNCIDQALNQRQDMRLLWNTKSLDGQVFFESSLENPHIYPDQEQAQKVKAALKQLRDSVTTPKIEPVSPFYAVLMMDGDSLGKHMSDSSKQRHISHALEQFTEQVDDIVRDHSGFLIYAGGDDVLALLPLEYALNCAKALRDHYLSCFAPYPAITTTISAALELAHIKMPLGKVLGDAHHLLDDIAKDQTGRDAIAVRVWKPGGQHVQWAMPWDKALANDGVVIDQLAADFRQDQQSTPFSHGFFFHVEQRFAMLNNKQNQPDWPFTEDVMVDLIAADYLNSGVNRSEPKAKITLAQARERIRPLLAQCATWRRIDTESEVTFQSQEGLNSDALQLIRFLAQKGVEYGQA